MEFAAATKQTNGFSALSAAACQLLLLIALGFAASYIVSACLSLACEQVSTSLAATQKPRLSVSADTAAIPFSAELCSTALPEFARRSQCDLPK